MIARPPFLSLEHRRRSSKHYAPRALVSPGVDPPLKMAVLIHVTALLDAGQSRSRQLTPNIYLHYPGKHFLFDSHCD